ncbi:MAG TPA: feruloyl-CoA synthase [Caulobacteraceae bacterium]|jgi:feruloyl-CoA synthase|nr:feruloyl-CoA synthase [Caulobacteraceae bacterium]
MNAAVDPPIRDPRYRERRVEVEPRADGSIILSNPTPYSAAFQTTNAALDHWATRDPQRTWLAERSGLGWRRISYSEARERVSRLAGALQGLGLGPGRPLLILAGNGIDHALVAYAAMRIGAAVAPVSPQYGQQGAEPGRLAHAVDLVRPAAVFVDDAAVFAEALGRDVLARRIVIAGRHERRGDVPLQALMIAGEAVPDLAKPDDIAKLLLTSGSTGRPKAVIGLQRNLALNSAQIEACFNDPEPPLMVHGAPWSHSLGGNAILHMGLHRGGTLYIDHGQPTPARFGETVRNLKEVSTTYHNMVPAGFGLLAHELERDEDLARTFFARVRLLQYGGAGLAQSICDRIQAVALRTVGEAISFGSGYGATETGPTACNVHWPNLRAGMIGLPLPGTSVKLAPEGEKYEIRVAGPQISPGYYNAPPELASPFDDEGYYQLGDAARMLDPERPELGMVFDGRLVENFKLSSGTFIAAGTLRLSAISAIGGAVSDAVVCGEGRGTVGLLLFLNAPFCAKLGGEAEVVAAVRAGLERLNAQAMGAGGKVGRALILDGAPDPHSGEITDKGYINQALARARRVADVERLFTEPAEDGVLVF